MWSVLLISLLLVIPVYNREHSGRHCMDIIECVVFLLRPLHQIPFLFSGGHAEIRLNDACRAGVPAFRVQKSAFYDFSLLGARQLHRPCLANRFLTVSVSHGGFSLIPFSSSIRVFVSCFAREHAFFSGLCHYSSAGDGFSGPSIGTVRKRHQGLRETTCFARGPEVSSANIGLYARHQGTVVHKNGNAGDRDGILCIVYGVGLSCCVHKNILCTGVRGG